MEKKLVGDIDINRFIIANERNQNIFNIITITQST